MQKTQAQIDKIVAFQQRDKFSTKAWSARGLNPSSREISNELNKIFNLCADKLIACLNTDFTNKKLKKVLQSTLLSLNKSDYNTEEKEFICDLFYELATIIEVDFKSDLNKWVYGSLLATVLKISKILKPTRYIEILSQPCSKCGTGLESYIVQKEKGIPDSSWLIVKCLACNELNLVSTGPDIKELKFGNYEWVETLVKNQYNYDQAATRLEQIKYFRKS